MVTFTPTNIDVSLFTYLRSEKFPNIKVYLIGAQQLHDLWQQHQCSAHWKDIQGPILSEESHFEEYQGLMTVRCSGDEYSSEGDNLVSSVDYREIIQVSSMNFKQHNSSTTRYWLNQMPKMAKQSHLVVYADQPPPFSQDDCLTHDIVRSAFTLAQAQQHYASENKKSSSFHTFLLTGELPFPPNIILSLN